MAEMTKISSLPEKTTFDGEELVPLAVKDSANYQAKMSTVKTYMTDGMVSSSSLTAMESISEAEYNNKEAAGTLSDTTVYFIL